MAQRMKVMQYINKNTGEVFGADEIITKYEKTEGSKRLSRAKKGNNLLFDLFGNFIFLHYGNVLDIDIDVKYLFRFIYLSTYIDYKEGKLMKTERTPLKENDLKDILKLSNKMELSRTLKALKDADLIYIKDNLIYVKNKYVSKGKVKRRGKLSVDDEFTKIFINGIRKLYESVDRKDDKFIGVIFRLLPYVNKHYNIICNKESINHYVLEDIKPLKTSEIGKILNLGRKKTLEALMLARLEDMPVFLGVIKENTKIENIHYYINPCIYYQGSADNEEAMKFLCNMFKIK